MVLVYNEFKSVMSQRVVVEQVLPMVRAAVDGEPAPPVEDAPGVDYLYEPSPQADLRLSCCRATSRCRSTARCSRSNAAFFAAQMTAMDTATKNSAEMIGSLTLYMNKVRQAAITREIIEVVSGAQAL